MGKRLYISCAIAVLVGIFLLSSLSAVTEEKPSNEPEIPVIISEVLSGKTADLQNILSNLEDKDLPLTLTVCEVLQHIALHRDGKGAESSGPALAIEAVDAFRASVIRRLETSQTVVIPSSGRDILPRSWLKIPAREIIIEGKHLIVREYYLAPEKFAITYFSPTGEAGTILPNVEIRYNGGKEPVAAKILLDGKELGPPFLKKGGSQNPPERLSDSTFGTPRSILCRLPPTPECLLSIGTHTAQAFLTDSTGSVASVSWTFTVGMEPVPTPSLPEGAVPVGSFSVTLDWLMPSLKLQGSVMVNIYESGDGKRILEYCSVEDNQGQKLAFKTTSLFLLKTFVTKKNKPATVFSIAWLQ